MSRHYNLGDRNDPRRNEYGYLDKTAHDAIKNVRNMSETSEEEITRFKRLLGTIFYICELAGFEVRGRIILVDKKTKRVWK